MKFKVMEREDYTIVHFVLEGAMTPDELREIRPPSVDSTKGVILSGRGPIWLYCFLAHYYHPTKFIATFDPRLGGAVVVESHCRERRVGDLIEVSIDET